MEVRAQPVPNHGAIPAAHESSSSFLTVKKGRRRLPSRPQASHADKKVVQHHNKAFHRTSHSGASSDSAEFVPHSAPERCDLLRHLMDPLGHIHEILNSHAPLDQKHADEDSMRDIGPTLDKTIRLEGLGDPLTNNAVPRHSHPLLRTSGFRTAGSFTKSTAVTLEEEPLPSSSAGSHDDVAAGTTAGDDEVHAPPPPTRPPPPVPRPLRRVFSDAARRVVRDPHSALTRASSEPTQSRPPLGGRIKILWKPPSKFTYGNRDDFFPESATSRRASLVFAGQAGRYWDPNFARATPVTAHTSLKRNTPPVGPYSSTMARD